MNTAAQGLMNREAQGHWIRLETLTRVRWLAAFGQVVALLASVQLFDLQIPLVLCLSIVAVSVASNLLSGRIFPRSKRLSETEALLTLIFDTLQLALLLFLTGGLNNPFALLLIAPVTIAATALQTRATLILGLIAVALASFLALVFEPLHLADGAPLLLPDIFRFGFWLAVVVGIAFCGLYSRSIAAEKHALAEALMAMQLALAREQKLTDLGGVIAAAAHELGTPLATIKLVSAELIDALDRPDLAPDLIEDARLIREQADRCRAILRSMGQAGKDDLHLRSAPLEAAVAEAAAPHVDRGRKVTIEALSDDRMPEIARRPEVIHGLRNLIQNAVDFAQSQVWIDLSWTGDTVEIRVVDDGPGFPLHLLDRIGDPYLRDRTTETRPSRPEYDGMGLGLFIAKTLLERTGAEVRFANCSPKSRSERGAGERSGAMAEVVWPRRAIESDARRPLGQNTPHVSS